MDNNKDKMAQTLGEKLRQAREAQGITISDIAEQTRISPLYIESIENDDYRPLPGGIFNKGFVKSYARCVGIDEQEALQDYSELISQQSDYKGDEPQTYRPEVLTDDHSSSSMLPTIIIAIIILGLMTWGLLALVRYFQNKPDEAENIVATNSNSASNVNVVVTPTPVQVPSMENLKVEFKTSNDPISLTTVSDGKKTYTLVKQDAPAAFQPKESLKIGFAKSLASNAQLTINGKQIKLPSQPENPNRVPIEVEINKDNIGQIWQSGEISFEKKTTPDTSPK